MENKKTVFALFGLFFIGLLVVIYSRTKESLPEPASTATSTPVASAQTPRPLNTPTQTFSATTQTPTTATPIESEPERGKFRGLQNPFCQSEEKGFITLPSMFLREFYSKSKSWIALPQSLAKCFTEGKSTQLIFFEYAPEFKLPWMPLVGMRGQITSAKEFPSLLLLEKSMESKQYKVKHPTINNIFSLLRSNFIEQMNDPWVLLEIAGSELEASPSYWPKTPVAHVQARLIEQKAFQDLMASKSGGASIIDVRSKEDREKSKIPYSTFTFKLKKRGLHRVIVHPSELELGKNALLTKLSPSQNIVIIGNNDYDQNTYNAANFLTMLGYQNIFVLKNGILALGIPGKAKELLSEPQIEPEALRSLRSADRNTLLVDCRSPGASRAVMPGAIKVAFKDGDQEEKIDVQNILHEIQTRRPTQVVLFGANGLDPKPNKVKDLLSQSGAKISILKNGFANWQFASKYRWDTSEKKPLIRTRNHAAPERKRMATQLPARIKIVPKETQGRAAGSVPPQQLKQEDIDRIQRNR